MTIVDDYGHHPTELAATIAAAREALPGPAPARALPAAPLLAHAPPRATSSARRSPAADDVVVTDIYAAREQPVAGVTGKLVVDALSDRGRLARRGCRASRGGARTWRAARDRATSCSCSARATSTRAARSSAAARALGDRDSRRASPLSRFTTIGTGGPARFFARPGTLDELEELLALGRGGGPRGRGDRARLEPARPRRRASTRSCCGSPGELAAARVEGTTLVAGGGATNAVCLHRARDAGLGGLEFASAIPGTAGGGVRMNAGAYGSDWRGGARSMRSSSTRSAARTARRPTSSGSRYRHSSLAPGRGRRARCASGSTPRPVDEIKAEVAALLAQRKATQPTTKRTFGSVFKNPADGAGRRAADRGAAA